MSLKISIRIEQLAQNYQQVLNRIQSAATSAGRSPDEVELIAVTKYVDAEVVRALYDIGCRQFGESRPQSLWQKADALKDLSIDWHMIGHLQTNKVRRTLPITSLIHSGDSLKVLKCINEEAEKSGRTADVLCEVNISGDESKHGFRQDQLIDSLEQFADLKHVRIRGMMAMASREGGAEQARKDFEQMQELRSQLLELKPASISLGVLSMGMSGDFEEAIACGATLVRVGSILFEGVLDDS